MMLMTLMSHITMNPPGCAQNVAAIDSFGTHQPESPCQVFGRVQFAAHETFLIRDSLQSTRQIMELGSSCRRTPPRR